MAQNEGYLSSRDVDFAYWAINGIKYSDGFNSANGGGAEKPRFECGGGGDGGFLWIIQNV